MAQQKKLNLVTALVLAIVIALTTAGVVVTSLSISHLKGNPSSSGDAWLPDGTDAALAIGLVFRNDQLNGIAQQALAKSNSTTIKKYADQIIQKTQDWNNRLNGLLDAKGIDRNRVTKTFNLNYEPYRVLKNKLTNLSGREFDRTFAGQMNILSRQNASSLRSDRAVVTKPELIAVVDEITEFNDLTSSNINGWSRD